jgi:hypothetical protein
MVSKQKVNQYYIIKTEALIVISKPIAGLSLQLTIF